MWWQDSVATQVNRPVCTVLSACICGSGLLALIEVLCQHHSNIAYGMFSQCGVTYFHLSNTSDICVFLLSFTARVFLYVFLPSSEKRKDSRRCPWNPSVFAFWLKLPSCSFSNTHLIAKKCPPCFILFPAKLLTHERDEDEWSDVTPFTPAPIQIDKLQLLIDPHQLCFRYFSFVSFWHLMLFSNIHYSPEFNRVADNG